MKSVQIRSYFWYVFSCIWSEYRDLWSKSPYSVRIQENMDAGRKLNLHKTFRKLPGSLLSLNRLALDGNLSNQLVSVKITDQKTI